MATWINCGNCGRSFDLDHIPSKRSKAKFFGATQHQQKCPCCKVALATTVVEDEADQEKRVDPTTLDSAVVSEMSRGNCDVKTAKAARVKFVKEAAATKR